VNHQIEYKCIREDCGGACFGCTLGSCVACGQSEGGLATECPGAAVTTEQADAIYAGKVDFRGGVWVDLA
jgi:hypothetical protein